MRQIEHHDNLGLPSVVSAFLIGFAPMKLRHLGLALLTVSATLPWMASAATVEGVGRDAGVKAWSSRNGTYVVLRVPKQHRTYYFVNDESRLCFSFWLPGNWHPTPEPGLLESDNARDHAGALVMSAAQLQKYAGKTLLSRAVSLHLHEFEQRHGKKADSSKTEAFESRFPGSIRWTADWYVEHGGRRYLAEVVRVMAKVEPEWVVAVTASHGTNGADTARGILKSFTTTHEPGCFRSEIHQLRGSN